MLQLSLLVAVFTRIFTNYSVTLGGLRLLCRSNQRIAEEYAPPPNCPCTRAGTLFFSIGLPVFSNQHDVKLNQDHKGLPGLVTGLRVKTKEQTRSGSPNQSVIAKKPVSSLKLPECRDLRLRPKNGQGRVHRTNRQTAVRIQPMPRVDHSSSLVKIANQLGDSPFGVIHHRLAPAFNIVVLWVIGRHGTASRNLSAMRRLLSFSADLIISFRAQHTGTKGEVRPFGV
uniref:Secreted protein n=1 Tax=Solanum tuberosum TaxID=4113 RepID=M1DUX5_SOLTU